MPTLFNNRRSYIRFGLVLGALSSLPLSNMSALAQNNPSINPSSAYATDGLVAVVGETPILKSELANAIRTAQANLQANGQIMPSSEQLRNEVLDQLIMQELQLDLVKRAGIRPNSDTVNQRLAKIAQSQGIGSLQQLQQRMDTRNPGSYTALRKAIIEEESLKVLSQRQVASRVRITEQDIDAFLSSPESQRLRQSEYRTIHIRVPYLDNGDQPLEVERQQALVIAQKAKALLQTSNDTDVIMSKLSSGVAKDYAGVIQGGDMGYHPAAGLPTTISSTITQLKIGEVTEPQITPQGIDIVKLVDKRGGDAMLIDQWRVRHILVKPNNVQGDALAKQKIEDLYTQLQEGADFASLAATYSNDPGSAGRGGDLDWVSKGQLVPEFEQMMMRTAVNDYSIPFESEYGWHILKVEDMRQQDVSDSVQRKLARDVLYQRLAPQAQEDWLQELRASAYIQVFD